MKRTVAIIDDDKDIVSAIETILSMEGYETLHAYNGRDSFKLLKTQKPHLILLDYMLPDMTGRQVVEAIRGTEELEDIPIVLISAAHGLKEIGENLSIQAWIAKPFELDMLIETVNKFANKTKNTSI